MSSNKGARQRLIQKFGNICMVEEAGIRKTPIEERRKFKGYRKSQDMITYHHIRPKHKGGQATEENGALVKGYNHEWLERLPVAEREKVNTELQRFKLNFATMHIEGDSLVTDSHSSIDLTFDIGEDYLVIPAYDNDEKTIDKRKKSRAQIKRETQRRIAEELDMTDFDDWDR